jgi:protein TonB
MVPPEEIEKAQPATLPADFGEWDSGDDSAVQTAKPEEFDRFHGSGGAPKPPAKSAAARVAVLPVAGRSSNASSRTSATAYANVEPVYQPPQSQTVTFGSQSYEAESTGNNKKMVKFGAIGVVAVLLIGGGAMGYMKMRPKTVAPNQQVESQTAMTNMQKPTAATSATTGNAPTVANTAADTTPTPTVPLRAQSDAMNKQLNAPSRISNDLKALTGREAPPSSDFGSSGVEGMGGGGNVFSGQSGPKVKVEAAKKVNISAGVAVGLLIQKTAPAYPPLAKAARVSGTVVLQATIGKNGSVGNLRAVSGPAMLRQSAMDAVKKWRFRPYLLDGEPVEVETTVNVTFALAQ